MAMQVASVIYAIDEIMLVLADKLWSVNYFVQTQNVTDIFEINVYTIAFLFYNGCAIILLQL